MIEVHPRLWLGNDDDARDVILGREGIRDEAMMLGWRPWALVSAAKEPYHRALVRYPGRAAPEGPERFSARRGRHLALNWVDVDDPKWFRVQEAVEAFNHIDAAQRMEIDCLVHCNQGVSRSPSLVLLWLRREVEDWRGMAFERAEERLRTVYPAYDPTDGVREFVRRHW